MRYTSRPGQLATILAAMLGAAQAHAQQQEFDQAVALGYAHIHFNTSSGELAGPLTPEGVRVRLQDTQTLAFSYTRRLAGPWSLLLQAGVPPTVNIKGAGTAAALGQAGSSKAWFPAALVTYTAPNAGPLKPYAGLGLNYTFFTNKTISGAYTAAFGGSASNATMSGSLGGVAKLGSELALSRRWYADFAYSHYWIRTTATVSTATPGAGDVARTLDVGADPNVFSVMLGYRF